MEGMLATITDEAWDAVLTRLADKGDWARYRLNFARSHHGRSRYYRNVVSEPLHRPVQYLYNAARSAPLHVVKYLRLGRGDPAPWNASTVEAAATNGRYSTLRWMRENGCPWPRVERGSRDGA
jgi:hypothetical protein